MTRRDLLCLLTMIAILILIAWSATSGHSETVDPAGRQFLFEGDRAVTIGNPYGFILDIRMSSGPTSNNRWFQVPADGYLSFPSIKNIDEAFASSSNNVFIVNSCYKFYLWTWTTSPDGTRVLTSTHNFGDGTSLTCDNDGVGGSEPPVISDPPPTGGEGNVGNDGNGNNGHDGGDHSGSGSHNGGGHGGQGGGNHCTDGHGQDAEHNPHCA